MASSSPSMTLLKNKKETVQQQEDTLLTVSHQIENLDQESAFSMVPTLLEDTEYNLFKLGGVLSVIRNHNWFGEHKNFKELVEKEFNLEYRKAMYLAEIYDKLVENEVPWESVKDVGWTKLRILARHLTPENVEYWVSQAKKLTAIQLMDAIKQSTKPDDADAEEGPTTTSNVTTMTFKIHEDQKDVVKLALQKVKEETETEFDNVALERLCTAYLSGSVVVEAHSAISDQLKSMGWEQALAMFDELWPEVNIVVQV